MAMGRNEETTGDGAARSAWLRVRGLDAHVRRWGRPGARPLVLLHGGRECADTFTFLVESLAGDWDVFAPDWRGHGLSGWAEGGYWTHDFIADLEALLDGLGLREPVDVIGHSLGGNVASLYAGLRPAAFAGSSRWTASAPPRAASRSTFGAR